MSGTAAAWLGVLFLAWPLTAQAQGPPSTPKTVEVSGTAAGFVGSELWGPGVRVSFLTGRRYSIEGGLDWTDGFHERHRADQVVWTYFWQVKQTVGARKRTTMYLTYGTLGWIERTTVPSGHLVGRALPPFLPLVGLATQHVIADRMALRFDLQAMIWPFEAGFIFSRLGAGVTVPISGFAR